MQRAVTGRAPKKNLLLAFDAFGTLFTPRARVDKIYGEVAARHGINGFKEDELLYAFRAAFRDESKIHPNYGKEVGMDANKWWGNVIFKTFKPFLIKGQHFPDRLVHDLIQRFATNEAYQIYPDVLPFFRMLRSIKDCKSDRARENHSWPWEKTVVGIVSNSDDRISGILRSLGLRVGPRMHCKMENRVAKSDVDDDISFVVLSYDVGHEKPHPRMFEAATQLLKETLADDPSRLPQDTHAFERLFIGDDLKKDVLGAKEAGWNSLYLDRKGVFSEHLQEKGPIVLVDASRVDGDAPAATQVHAIGDLSALKEWRPSGT